MEDRRWNALKRFAKAVHRLSPVTCFGHEHRAKDLVFAISIRHESPLMSPGRA